MDTAFSVKNSQARMPDPTLPARITKAGSRQTYYTFLLLADPDRRQDAFRAYAYFRWLDDILDLGEGTRQEKSAFVQRQMELLASCYQGEPTFDVSPEEQMLVDLVHNDIEQHSGLRIYLHNMMKVMAFDVERCGRAITHAELTEYTHWLSSAVTEVLFYLIGHKNPPALGEARYHAVCGAHVVHMLRDAMQDISAGYFNIPEKFLDRQVVSPETLNSVPFRRWVYERARLAHRYFNIGRKYIAGVKNLRCRLAGFAYLARFEWMLRAIERDGYCLRFEYKERKTIKAAVWMGFRALCSLFNLPWTISESYKPPALIVNYEE